MSERDAGIEAGFRKALVARVGRERFELWFGPLVQLELGDQHLRVTAPDQFTVDRLRHGFRHDLLAVAREVLGGEPRVEYRVDGALRRAVPPPSTASPRLATRPSDGEGPAERAMIAAASTVTRPAARPRAELDDFVVGDGSRVAHAAARSVVQRPGHLSPLMVFGPTGCGKSMLLEGIASSARRTMRRGRVVMLSAEQFTSHFLEALQGSGLPSFRRKYRDLEMLLIDDVQFFASKRATLVELQHTVDTLLRSGRQLVFAANRPPAELSGFGREIVARLSQGLVCQLEPPELAARLGILRKLVARRDCEVPDEVLQRMAAQLGGDGRQLAGALNRLEALSEALEQPVTVELAETALADLFRTTRPLVRLADIERAVCDVFGLDSQTLQSARKVQAVSQPRMLAMWLARKHTRAALSEIGNYFGRRSHSTVISAQNKVQRWMKANAAIRLAHGDCQIEDAIRRVETHLRTG